jgi:hypothetical protein
MDRNQNTNPTTKPARPTHLRAAVDWLAIAHRTKRALKPVAPPSEFRARLRDGLRMAAYHREARDLIVQPRAATPWRLLVGAAALGSAAGLLALVLRARQGAHLAEPVTARE